MIEKRCISCEHGDKEVFEEPCKTCVYFNNWTPAPAPAPAPPPAPIPTAALDVQVAGDHYKSKKIQPVEYISANNLNFLEGCIVKRITRWRDKPAESRFEDLEKIKHEADLLIETKHGR
jgi:hypothetical protein